MKEVRGCVKNLPLGNEGHHNKNVHSKRKRREEGTNDDDGRDRKKSYKNDDDSDSKGDDGGADGYRGLSSIPEKEIRMVLKPLVKALEELDAEKFLGLERIVQRNDGAVGAELCSGIKVKPIHNHISPKRYENSCVRYLDIDEVESQYSIGIFVFPPRATIPLHDHPGMSVLSRVLYGDLMVKSFDLVPAPSENDDHQIMEEEEEEEKKEEKGAQSIDVNDQSCEKKSDVSQDKTVQHEQHLRKSISTVIRDAFSTSTSSPTSWLSSLISLRRGGAGAASESFSSSSSSNTNTSSPSENNNFRAPYSSTSSLLPLREEEEKPQEEEEKPQEEGSIRATENPIKRLMAPEVTTLYPFKGNAHEFNAGENGAAVFDILIPPYDFEHDRDCTFYRPKRDGLVDDDENDDGFFGRVNSSVEKEEDEEQKEKLSLRKKEKRDGNCWLIPIPQPEGFHCVSGKYGRIGTDER